MTEVTFGTIEERIQRKQDEIAILQGVIESARELQKIYLDIQYFKFAYSLPGYCAASVNAKADRSLFTYSPAIYLMPHVMNKGLRIYSNPPAFYIGMEKDDGDEFYLKEDWESPMREAGMSKAMFGAVHEYLKNKTVITLNPQDAQSVEDYLIKARHRQSREYPSPAPRDIIEGDCTIGRP